MNTPDSDGRPSESERLTYRDSGVDIEAASRVVGRLKEAVRSTFSGGVLADIGSFGAMFDLSRDSGSGQVLVASADGVGTKLKLAFLTGRHDTVGEDLVNHCINDVLVMGARPLFFLDYVASGAVDEGVMGDVLAGFVRGCRNNGVALIGGETAEMPGFYPEGEYDLVGFILGRVERDRILDGSAAQAGDVLLGLASSGLHTNGYSLARKVVLDTAGLGPDDELPGCGATVADVLLRVHRSYHPSVGPLLSKYSIRSMAHITGGGFIDNIPRALSEGLSAKVRPGSWPVPPEFAFIEEQGNVELREMYRTFNMGIGLVLIVPEEEANGLTRELESAGESVYPVGELTAGAGEVILE
ncbi:phosphoribosylformylglycinamidine cyclo-ligase [candidate division KSB1 bacterium]